MSCPAPFFTKKPRSSTVTYAGLLDLPVELIHYVFLLAREPMLPRVNKALQEIFSPSQVPVSFKVDFLLACWHDAYAYGFDDVQAHPTMSSIREARIFESGIKERGYIMEGEALQLMKLRDPASALIWNAGMLPVNAAWFSRCIVRRATHHVTNYVLRFPICDDTVFARLEQKVLRLREFGNICFTIGVDPRGSVSPPRSAEHKDKQSMSTSTSSSHPSLNPRSLGEYGGYFSSEGAELERSVTASRCQPGPIPKPRSLVVTELPRRLFRSFTAQYEPFPSPIDASGDHARFLPISQTPNRGSPQPDTQAASMGQSARSYDDELAEQLHVILKPFGPPPYMATGHTLLLLRLLCVNSSAGFDRPDQTLLNSHDGYPLARATLAKCQPIVRLLLFFGASATAKNNLSPLIAIRAGWLTGAKTLVDALPCSLLTECQNLTQVVNSWIAARDAITLKLSPDTKTEELRRQLAFNPAWIESEKRFMTPIEHMPLLAHTRPVPATSSRVKREAIVAQAVAEANDEDVLFSVALMDDGPHYLSDEEGEQGFEIPQAIANPRLQTRHNVVPDVNMLFEAVRLKKWDVVEWLRDEKGIVPDLRTIALLEKLEGDDNQPKKKKYKTKT